MRVECVGGIERKNNSARGWIAEEREEEDLSIS